MYFYQMKLTFQKPAKIKIPQLQLTPTIIKGQVRSVLPHNNVNFLLQLEKHTIKVPSLQLPLEIIKSHSFDVVMFFAYYLTYKQQS
jgi:hypothetical protein